MAIQELEAFLEGFSDRTAEVMRETQEVIFNRGNIREIEAYRMLVERLNEYAKDPEKASGLLAHLENAAKLFEEQASATPERAAEEVIEGREDAEEYIPVREAVQYWAQKDEEDGREPLLEHSYFRRIRDCADNFGLKVQKAGKRIRMIEKQSLDDSIKKYRKNRKNTGGVESRRGPAPNPGRYTFGDNVTANGYDEYVTLAQAVKIFRELDRDDFFSEAIHSDTPYANQIKEFAKENEVSTRGAGRGTVYGRVELVNRIGRNKLEDRPSLVQFMYHLGQGLSEDEAFEKMGIVEYQIRGVKAAYKRWENSREKH